MREFNKHCSRRTFIAAVAGTGTAVFVSPMLSMASEIWQPALSSSVAESTAIDAHAHVEVPLDGSHDNLSINLALEMKRSGFAAICMTFAVDYQELKNPGDAYERFINGLNAMDVVVKKNGLERALTADDILEANRQHRATVIQAVEGAHFLEGKLERVKLAYDRGLRVLGLLHDNDASVPLGDIYTKDARWGGLTDFGAEVIRECNKLGILVDLAHASNATLDEALSIAKKPVIVSHTGLDTQLGTNPDIARMMRPRLISREQAKIIANAGGVIGVWTHLAETPTAYAQNVRALVDTIGIEHVCIGTDSRIKAQGNNTSAASRGFYYAVVDAMLSLGFTTDEITRIASDNFMRIFKAATAL